jgi:hypothetical protein
LIFIQERCLAGPTLFRAHGLLAGHRRFFLRGKGVVLGLLLVDFLLIRFRRSISHMFHLSLLWLSCVRNKTFSAGNVIMLLMASNANKKQVLAANASRQSPGGPFLSCRFRPLRPGLWFKIRAHPC